MSAPPNFARVCDALFSSMGWSFVINSVFHYSLKTKCTDERWGKVFGLFKRHGLTRLFMVLNYPHILTFNCNVLSLIRSINYNPGGNAGFF